MKKRNLGVVIVLLTKRVCSISFRKPGLKGSRSIENDGLLENLKGERSKQSSFLSLFEGGEKKRSGRISPHLKGGYLVWRREISRSSVRFWGGNIFFLGRESGNVGVWGEGKGGDFLFSR